jgi:O-antigen ligase
MLILWFVLLLTNFYIDHEYYKGHMSLQLAEARHYTKLFLFVILAWWMSGFPRIVFFVLFLAVIGFLLGPMISGYDYIHGINIVKHGGSISLGYRNREHTSVYASFTLLFFVLFRKRLVNLWPDRQWIGVLVVTIGVSYSLIVIYVATTRATYFGFGIAILAWVFYQIYKIYVDKLSVNKNKVLKVGLVLTILFLVFVMVGFNPFSKFAKRMNEERDVIGQLVGGDFDDLRLSNIGVRIYLWTYAIEKLKDQPLVGLGPRTREQLLAEKQVPDRVKKAGIGHFHNSYIELLLAYGILGAFIFAAMVSYIIYGVVQARKKQLMPDDMFNFVLVFSVYWFSVNLVESYFIYTTGFYINALLGGTAITFYLKAKHSYRQEVEIALDELKAQDAPSFADAEKTNRVERI